MRLGVVGLCGDFRTLTSDEIAKIKALEFTGLSFHFRSAEIPSVPPDACSRCVQMLEDANLDLVQFGITYEECLFHPDSRRAQSRDCKRPTWHGDRRFSQCAPLSIPSGESKP